VVLVSYTNHRTKQCHLSCRINEHSSKPEHSSLKDCMRRRKLHAAVRLEWFCLKNVVSFMKVHEQKKDEIVRLHE